jgi:tetratricopeptide (TPR) repeat protein
MDRTLPIWIVCCILLMSAPVPAQPAIGNCVEGSDVLPERMIEDCDALLMDKATAETMLPSIFLARAEAFVRQGRLKLAIEDLGIVVERRPDNAKAFFKRAELQRTRGDPDAAIRDFSSAIRLEPKNVTALMARAELYRAKTDRRRALADYTAVLRVDHLHEAAAANRKALALEIERLGAMMPVEQR